MLYRVSVGRKRKPSVAAGSPTRLGRKLGVTRQRAHQLMNPEKHRARYYVSKAVRNGILVKPLECERCLKRKRAYRDIQAHHEDYNSPLDVQWLCAPCHNIVHPHGYCARNKQLLETLRVASANRNERRRRIRVNNAPLVMATKAKTESIGYAFEPLNTKAATVNGHLCALRSFGVRPSNPRYHYIGPLGARADGARFVVLHDKTRGLWAIFPRNIFPKSQTLFLVTEPSTNRRGASGNRHDFRQFINAWHLLKN